MTSAEKWNFLVQHYNKNRNALEKEVVQPAWEKIFSEIFGYMSITGEIVRQPPVRLGRTDRGAADILIRQNKTDLFVVELKRYNNDLTDDMCEQLLSYMRLLCCEIGIIICDKIYVFNGSGRGANESKMVSIDFVDDNPDGIKFIELFSKGSFNTFDISTFFENKVKLSNDIKQIKSEITPPFIIEILRGHFLEKYSQEAFEAVKKTLDINVSHSESVPIPATILSHQHDIDNGLAQSQSKEKMTHKKKITPAMTKASYDIAKQVVDKKLRRLDAPRLIEKMSGMTSSSAGMYVNNFIEMRKGEKLPHGMNIYSYEFFLENIYQDYGDAGLCLALESIKKTVEYRASMKLSTGFLITLIEPFEAKLQ